jgi:hypothetical protein
MPKTKHRAFFASPFAGDYAWIRSAVATACRELDIEFRPVDEMMMPGTSIIDAIHVEIARCTMAFVVVSGLNANVFYELGLLHAVGKPTILLSDSATMANLPFDIRSLMVARYDESARNERELKQVVIAAAARMIRLLDEPAARTEAITGAAPTPAPSSPTAQLAIAQYDFNDLKERASRAVGQKNCGTTNISEYDDGTIKGWKLKARCSGGSKMNVIIDVNGDIREIDVE